MIDAGNTAWLITATALVLFMTLPGLALVRVDNLLSVLIQLTGIVATLLWSAAVSFVIAKVVHAVTGLRVSAETEEQGLDLRIHGERGYNV